MKHLVFTYGSLKRGMTYHHLLAGQLYVGVAQTTPHYSLHRLSSFPAMIDHRHPEWVGGDSSVWGELYEVDDTRIADLDRLEGTEIGMYTRDWVGLKQIHVVQLPHYADSFNCLINNRAECYLSQQSVADAENCGSFWTPG